MPRAGVDLLWLLVAGAPAGADVTIEQLTAPPTVTAIEISPDGHHLASRVFSGKRYGLVFLDGETMKAVGGAKLPESLELGEFHWVNNERVVGEVYRLSPDGKQPRYRGELFGTNIDASRFEVLTGFLSGSPFALYAPNDLAFARIIDLLPDDERHILISRLPWSGSIPHKPSVRQLDVYSGKQRTVNVPVTRIDSMFFTDRQGNVRVIISRDDAHDLFVQTHAHDGEWVDVAPALYSDNFTPLAVTEDGAAVHALDDIDGDRLGLYELALDATRVQKIYQHDQVDVTEAIMSTDGRSVYALRVDDGYPGYLILSESHEEAEVLKSLLHTFEDMLVSIESRSRDGRFWVVRTGSDVDAGTFHLFDRKQSSVSKLLRMRADVHPEELASSEAISFTSFDGRRIHGYFTAAEPVGDRPAPLVVLLHEGLHARDYWVYDPTVQVLATRGFSVLQINFRGSSGYGEAFRAASAREWGAAVQQDVIAGTRWAITEQRAAPGRICTMGAGFGAYSAVQSAVIAPELFACVVARDGIYDLALLHGAGDISTWFANEAHLEREIGRDEEEIRRYSPVDTIDRLRAPVFIAHDRREWASRRHAWNLRKALDKHEKAYEWFFEERHAKGFYDNSGEVEYLEAVVTFLSEHLEVTRTKGARTDVRFRMPAVESVPARSIISRSPAD